MHPHILAVLATTSPSTQNVTAFARTSGGQIWLVIAAVFIFGFFATRGKRTAS